MPEPYDVRAQDHGVGSLFSICKTDYEDIITGLPEQSDIMTTNLLRSFGFSRESKGDTIGSNAAGDVADSAVQEAIKVIILLLATMWSKLSCPLCHTGEV